MAEGVAEPVGGGGEGGAADRTREVLGSPAHFVEAGAGPALFFLHDFLETLVGFAPLFAHLGPRFRRILVDLPGFGSTPTPEGWEPRLETYAEFVQAALRESAVRDGTLVLHGFGILVGLTALGEPAGEAARRISRVVVLNGPLYDEPARGLPFFRPKGPFEPLLVSPPHDLIAFRRRLLARFGNPTYFDEGYVEDLFQSWRPQGPRTLRALAPQLGEMRASLPRLRRTLKAWTGPVHVLWGEEDPLQGADPALRLKKEVKRARVLLFPDVGFLPHAEAPEAIATQFRRFVRVARPPPSTPRAPGPSSGTGV